MGVLRTYRLRIRRRRKLIRAIRKRRELKSVSNRTKYVKPNDVLLFCTLRNEHHRLEYFLKYYREKGVRHFFFVDNNSTDGSREYLAQQDDVSLWTTSASYKDSNFGMDWVNWLQMRYAHDHWTLTVDVDEFLVYPFCDTRSLAALTDWLEASEIRSFGAMLLDMYPKGGVTDQAYEPGTNPFESAPWFDSGNYVISRNAEYGNLWIQGGPRARLFFKDDPFDAPALNKVPLVKWNRRYAFASSTHSLLPPRLNHVYDRNGGEMASGCLLHAKFLDSFSEKAAEELIRKQHYAQGQEYQAYIKDPDAPSDVWCKWSERYINWRQLETLGLMSKGNWA
ncbi:glycosyltransferase family 2 protein [Halocynthiibacter namhaensis]|uniref:glycosyltransferase family 2 protein n=1 Tax=Halocynthiibacter namhaensis TaxID=1290553 RepID=UPI0009DF436B|nr:glycosyltransferase family 2 protein [Halocynthiibacter namhaensis]